MKCYRCGSWPCECRDGCTVIHGDCREVLPHLPKVDLVLTDPPYGIAACNRSDGGVGSISSGSKKYGRQKWDLKRPDDELISTAVAMGSNAVVWGGNYFALPPSSCWFVWDKMQREFTFADAELAWTNLDKAVRVLSVSRGELVSDGKLHPTQKPLRLISWCLGFFKDAATVLDPFAGSGTTLVASKLEGRRCTAIEIEERYVEIACKRLEQEVLF